MSLKYGGQAYADRYIGRRIESSRQRAGDFDYAGDSFVVNFGLH